MVFGCIFILICEGCKDLTLLLVIHKQKRRCTCNPSIHASPAYSIHQRCAISQPVYWAQVTGSICHPIAWYHALPRRAARMHAGSFHTSQKEALFVFMKSRCDMIFKSQQGVSGPRLGLPHCDGTRLNQRSWVDVSYLSELYKALFCSGQQPVSTKRENDKLLTW